MDHHYEIEEPPGRARDDALFWERVLYVVVMGVLVLTIPAVAWIATI
jgi:hypothetical protein